MALIINGILKQDQYSQSDIYYPPWDKIANYDGETNIISIAATYDSEEGPKVNMFVPIFDKKLEEQAGYESDSSVKSDKSI